MPEWLKRLRRRQEGPATNPGLQEALDSTLAPPGAEARKPFRLGLWVLFLGFGGFLLWAAWAPLDEGVSAPSTVAIETRRRVIQHFSGGVVRAVHVKEGQWVRRGDVLVELDDAALRANLEAVRQNYLGQRAAESRLVAEQLGQATIAFHPDVLQEAQTIASVRQHMDAQTRLFAARRAALQAEESAAREAIAGLEAQIAGLSAMLESRRVQAALLGDQIRNIKELADEGYAPRNQLLQLEQGRAELAAVQADLQANRQRAQQAIAETRMRIVQRRQEYQKESGAQLADLRREVQAGQERIQAITDELERTRIQTPADGQVVALAVSAVGGVLTPGQRLLDIVPKGDALLLDVRIAPHMIDRVKVGLETDVRFSAFANSPQLVVSGRLVSVSGDAISEQQGAAVVSYYLGRVQVTPEGLAQLGGRVLTPGMPAEVLIKTGERSLLTYLLKPLVKRMAGSMKEE